MTSKAEVSVTVVNAPYPSSAENAWLAVVQGGVKSSTYAVNLSGTTGVPKSNGNSGSSTFPSLQICSRAEPQPSALIEAGQGHSSVRNDKAVQDMVRKQVHQQFPDVGYSRNMAAELRPALSHRVAVSAAPPNGAILLTRGNMRENQCPRETVRVVAARASSMTVRAVTPGITPSNNIKHNIRSAQRRDQLLGLNAWFRAVLAHLATTALVQSQKVSVMGSTAAASMLHLATKGFHAIKELQRLYPQASRAIAGSSALEKAMETVLAMELNMSYQQILVTFRALQQVDLFDPKQYRWFSALVELVPNALRKRASSNKQHRR